MSSATSPETDLLGTPSIDPPAETKPSRIHLSRLENRALMDWLETNKDTAEKESDSALATLAIEALGFIVTKSHILSTRTALGITKAKPAPAPPSAQDVDLGALYRQVQEQGREVTALKIECSSLSALIPKLQQSIQQLQSDLAATSSARRPITGFPFPPMHLEAAPTSPDQPRMTREAPVVSPAFPPMHLESPPLSPDQPRMTREAP